jgi:hypothetical protein
MGRQAARQWGAAGLILSSVCILMRADSQRLCKMLMDKGVLLRHYYQQ